MTQVLISAENTGDYERLKQVRDAVVKDALINYERKRKAAYTALRESMKQALKEFEQETEATIKELSNMKPSRTLTTRDVATGETHTKQE